MAKDTPAREIPARLRPVLQAGQGVKGTEKFWTEEGAETLLQLRADYLSEDEPLEAFWQRRQEAATGQRRYRRRIPA